VSVAVCGRPENTLFPRLIPFSLSVAVCGWLTPSACKAVAPDDRLSSCEIARCPCWAVGTDDVLSVLRPLWSKTPETASRIRARLESVLDSATARGLRQGDNPARWKGHLETLLPARRHIDRTHYAAGLWVIPAKRMKAARAHRVPLPARAVEILRELYSHRCSDLLFPGLNPRRPMAKMSMWQVAKRIDKTATTHGFRSAARVVYPSIRYIFTFR
jgi:hypothetical protein